MKHLALLLILASGCTIGPIEEPDDLVPKFDEVDYEFIDGYRSLRCDELVWHAEQGDILCSWKCATYKGSTLPMQVDLVFGTIHDSSAEEMFFTGEIDEQTEDCTSGNL